MNKKKLSKKRNQYMKRHKKEAVIFNRLSEAFPGVEMGTSDAKGNVKVRVRDTFYECSFKKNVSDLIETIKMDILLGAT